MTQGKESSSEQRVFGMTMSELQASLTAGAEQSREQALSGVLSWIQYLDAIQLNQVKDLAESLARENIQRAQSG